MLDVQLSAGYGSTTTLHDTQFSLACGERAGLVGMSGAGKSTLVLALMGMLPWRKGWARGRVLLDGCDLLQCGERELRAMRGRKISLVPQSPASALNPALSLRTHFEEMWRAHAHRRESVQSRVQELLHRVELPADAAFLKRRPSEISVGQAQRVMIALALLHRPSLLIADEPTSALDVCTQQEIVHLLHEVSQEQNTALLYVSHDLISVIQLCERMLVLHQGSLVESLNLQQRDIQAHHPVTRKLLTTLPFDLISVRQNGAVRNMLAFAS